jgi:hypothetical protein
VVGERAAELRVQVHEVEHGGRRRDERGARERVIDHFPAALEQEAVTLARGQCGFVERCERRPDRTGQRRECGLTEQRVEVAEHEQLARGVGREQRLDARGDRARLRQAARLSRELRRLLRAEARAAADARAQVQVHDLDRARREPEAREERLAHPREGRGVERAHLAPARERGVVERDARGVVKIGDPDVGSRCAAVRAVSGREIDIAIVRTAGVLDRRDEPRGGERGIRDPVVALAARVLDFLEREDVRGAEPVANLQREAGITRVGVVGRQVGDVVARDGQVLGIAQERAALRRERARACEDGAVGAQLVAAEAIVEHAEDVAELGADRYARQAPARGRCNDAQHVGGVVARLPHAHAARAARRSRARGDHFEPAEAALGRHRDRARNRHAHRFEALVVVDRVARGLVTRESVVLDRERRRAAPGRVERERGRQLRATQRLDRERQRELGHGQVSRRGASGHELGDVCDHAHAIAGRERGRDAGEHEDRIRGRGVAVA